MTAHDGPALVPWPQQLTRAALRAFLVKIPGCIQILIPPGELGLQGLARWRPSSSIPGWRGRGHSLNGEPAVCHCHHRAPVQPLGHSSPQAARISPWRGPSSVEVSQALWTTTFKLFLFAFVDDLTLLKQQLPGGQKWSCPTALQSFGSWLWLFSLPLVNTF